MVDVDERAGRSRASAGRDSGGGRAGSSRLSTSATRLMERSQDIVSAAVGITLIVLAAGILVTGIVDFFRNASHMALTLDATDLLDSVLLVLILVEIVHTVVLSLRAHSLSAQPFLVVGLVAVIRKILFSLGSQQKLNVDQLWLYLGMAAVFVASLVAIHLVDGRRGEHEHEPDALEASS
jgi:uncharacterized membrane protein (DUF373 family)